MLLDNIMCGLKGKFCILEPYSEYNFDGLYEIDMCLERAKYFSDSPKLMSKRGYADYMIRRLNNYYHCFFAIRSISSNKIVGYVCSYNFNLTNGYVYMSINSNQTKIAKYTVAEAGIIFINYLFRFNRIRKIYADVYGFNKSSIHLMETAGFVKEAELKEHRFMEGCYHSLMTYALYSDSFYRINKRVIEYGKK